VGGGLHDLAARTGGLFFSNRNDLQTCVRQAADDQMGYYLLGYTPKEGTFDQDPARARFHKIVVRVARRGEKHDLQDLTVAVRFEGDFESAHVAGDNSAVLPTDTMKNTVYAVARESPAEDIEELALAQARLGNDRQTELAIAAEEQRKITRLRLEKLLAATDK